MVIVAGAGVAAGAIIRPFGGSSTTSSIDNGAPTGLATVTRGVVSARTSVDGKLGYQGDYTAINKASGTFTSLPPVGREVHQGDTLYRVSGKPVVLLKGRIPLYRALSEGDSGPDVRQLNADLVALKYATKSELSPHSKYFGSATADALEKLQDDLNVTQNGELAVGQAVFLPSGTARVTDVTAKLGGTAAPGTAVLQASSTTRQVSVKLDAASQSQVKVGDKVTITLPTMKTTPGVVSSVGTVAKSSSSGATIGVNITPSDPKATGSLDQAPVSVLIVTDSAKNVLSVPVSALLALASGGYAVEVVEAGGLRHLVPVTTGLFDDEAGTVQVDGSGLAAGQRVVVPST